MTTIELNKTVPDFTATTTGDAASLSLSSLRGQHVVLYFYPKDDTPGCTLEGQDFRDHMAAFAKENTVILGVSRDTIQSHQKFKCKYELPFELLSDTDEALCKRFGVLKEKNMYGKKVIGIERSTFLIDKEGVLRDMWRGVRVPGHVLEVLDKVKVLNR